MLLVAKPNNQLPSSLFYLYTGGLVGLAYPHPLMMSVVPSSQYEAHIFRAGISF